MTQRYHKAARDGLLDILKETTKRDTNMGDEDGMTPTLWAAFEGKLEALSLLVGRGGDPNKCDNYGNTALHLASARGHLDCVTFLVNFGVNIFSLDIDMHSAQDLAAMNDCSEILRFLDNVAANEEADNPKKVKSMQEKAQKDAEKLVKNFKKTLKKADKINDKDIKNLDKQMQKFSMMNQDNSSEDLGIDLSSNSSGSSVQNLAPKFSEITGGGNAQQRRNSAINQGTIKIGGKKLMGTVSKKLNLKKAANLQSNKEENITFGNGGAFTVSEIEDGKRSVRHLQGRRQSANVLFVPKKIEENVDQIDSNFETTTGAQKAGFMQNQRKSLAVGMTGGASIFDRPGIGSMAFRNSVSASLFAFHSNENGENTENSIGSAGSLAAEDEEDLPPFSAQEFAPVAIFLAGLGMEDWIKSFQRERIDLDALTLLGDNELKSMGLPLGPRMKILAAIQDRRKSIQEEQSLEDSAL